MDQDRPAAPAVSPIPRGSSLDRRFNEPNLRPTKAARQHTVPRLYLANFGNGDALTVYDLQEDRCFATSLKNAAVQVGYYDLDVGGLVVSTEDWLADIEAKAAPILSRLVADPDSVTGLTEAEEVHLARYIGAQRFRTPWFREFVRATDEYTAEQIKPMARAYINNTLPKDVADDLWKEWEKKPLEWWLGQTEPRQDADAATYMLQEVQGWANLLQAMPWRIGVVDPAFPLYTSDSPVAAYASPVLPVYTGPAFTDHTYMLPLSPRVLLWIEAFTPTKNCPGRGRRRRKDFNAWETSFTRHVVTRSATRFVFGSAVPLPRACASTCLERIDHWKGVDAIRLQGFDPYSPRRLPEGRG